MGLQFFLPFRMPPTSTNIFQEGAQIKSFKIVSAGRYDKQQLIRYLVDEPARFEGCSGTRCFRDVESDLKAQIAANNKGQSSFFFSFFFLDCICPQCDDNLMGSFLFEGVGLIYLLIEEYGLSVVQEYMLHVSFPILSSLTWAISWADGSTAPRLHSDP